MNTRNLVPQKLFWILIPVMALFGWVVLFSKSEAPNTQGAQQARLSGPRPASVTVATAVRMTMSPMTELPGSVMSIRDSVVASEASGKIVEVLNVGGRVKKGAVIARIDDTDARRILAQRQANIDRLKSQYEYRRNLYQRYSNLGEDSGEPEILVEQYRTNRDAAKADLTGAELAYAEAETNLVRTQIRAPFSGSIVSRSIQVGEYAQIGRAVARLVDTNALEVTAQVPTSLVQPISAGTLLRITGQGENATATLRAIVPVGNTVSRTMELRATLKGSAWFVGTPVRVFLPSAARRSVIAVPRDALILRPESIAVFVIKNDVAHRQIVTTGYGQGEFIEIVGDVGENDQVVIRGGERLRDGQKVDLSDIAVL